MTSGEDHKSGEPEEAGQPKICMRGLDWKDEELIDGKCLGGRRWSGVKEWVTSLQRSEHCQPMGGQLKNIFKGMKQYRIQPFIKNF